MVFVVQLFKMPDTKATCALSLYYLKVMLLVELVVWAVMLTIPINQEKCQDSEAGMPEW